jgi:ParB family transcriptional regulator, chromosome partitioning protein
MDLEFHQLDLRYRALRTRSEPRERRLLTSLCEIGQQVPVVVVALSASPPATSQAPFDTATQPGHYVLLDGYKRVRALRRLGKDTVVATCWALGEAEALLLERLMRSSEGDSVLEQAWLLRELRDRFGLSLSELSRRFDKTQSWVSRRLGLVSELPESIQKRVHKGEILPHVAMKYLLPMARANRPAAEQLAQGLPAHLSSRTASALYDAYTCGNDKTRELIRCDPSLFVRTYEESQRARRDAPSSSAALVRSDLLALVGVARRIGKRFGQGLDKAWLGPERDELVHLYRQALREVGRLAAHLDSKEPTDSKERIHVGSIDTHIDPAAA